MSRADIELLRSRQKSIDSDIADIMRIASDRVAKLEKEKAKIENKISVYEDILSDQSEGEAVENSDNVVVLDPVKSPESSWERPRSGPHLKTAANFMREIAMRLANERSDGFAALEVSALFAADENIDASVKDVTPQYIYSVLKKLRFEGLLDRVGDKYVLPGRVQKEQVSVRSTPVPSGYKLVPLTKAELIRQEVRRYLTNRKQFTAHRTQIADALCGIGIMGKEKNVINELSIYLAKWPEFRPDGKGNFTLDKTAKTGDDQNISSS